jgi:hypothetical protein
MESYETVRAALRAAVLALGDVGLRRSAAWAAELLCGLPPPADAPPLPPHVRVPPGELPAYAVPPGGGGGADDDVLLLARAHVDNREFLRAAHLLGAHFALDGGGGSSSGERRRRAPSPQLMRARFVRWHALFLVSRARAESMELRGRGEGVGAAQRCAPRRCSGGAPGHHQRRRHRCSVAGRAAPSLSPVCVWPPRRCRAARA